MPDMHILQVLPALESGGVERGTIEIAEALSKREITNSVASHGGRLCSDLDATGTRHFRLPMQSKLPWQIIANGVRLAKLVRAQDVSLIHTRSRAPAWACWIASKLTGIPYITTFHGVYGHHSKVKRWYNSAMLKGEHCIAVSDYVEQHIKATYSSYPPITKINRSVDTDYFDPTKSDRNKLDHLRNKWRISEHETVVLFPARYTRMKGHSILIEALKKLSNPSIKVIFVGKKTGHQDYVQELEARAKRYGLAPQLVFEDQISDMREAYALCDLVVSANTKPESFGRTLVESQAMQRRVIAPNLGCAESILTPEFGPNLYPSGSAEDLANTIESNLKMSQDIVSTQTRQAREYVKANYTLESMCTSTIALYESLHTDQHS